MLDVIKEILISEKEFTETNYKKLPKGSVYIENNLIDSDCGIYLTVDSLIEIRNGSDINLRKINVKPYGFDKIYMEKELTENKRYQVIDQFNEKNYIYKFLFNTLKQNASFL